MTTDALLETIFERLAAQHVPTLVAEFVLAAFGGEDAINEVLAGRPAPLPASRPAQRRQGAGIYLSTVEVEGFRGIGPRRTLRLSPRPGLTVVVGRNGSGKSSFAEAVELSLTGNATRWADRNSIWRGGWRNLHGGDRCTISTELHIDGSRVPTRVGRAWAPGADLSAATVTVTDATGVHHDLAALGLGEPVNLYRPFLTPADIGRLVSGTRSQLFDALDAILGLGALTEANRCLTAAARQNEAQAKAVRDRRQELRRAAKALTDRRAVEAARILGATRPDLDELAALLDDPADGAQDAETQLCRRLAQLDVPEAQRVTAAAAGLRAAAELATRHHSATVTTAVRIAEVLRLALDHHDATGDGPCPVCGVGRLDPAWHADAARQFDELRTSTVAANRAQAQLAEALRVARGLTTPLDLPAAPVPDPLAAPVATLTSALTALADAPATAEALADHLEHRYPPVLAAATGVRDAAAAWLRQEGAAWQALRDQFTAWLLDARALPEAGRLGALKAAATWLKKEAEQIRNDTLRPFADHTRRIWAELRQESNIDLGVIKLVGTATRRRIDLTLRVDGSDDAELGVVSQGELHALALATFLPRCCAPDSPFRFVIIDDPVQSLDPSKVDGLARVLADVATARQVIVFTHDGRLPDAIRRLAIDAEMIEVVRGERSAVTIRPSGDPISRYLDDANSVARTDEVPGHLRAPVVAELCRSALEAACHRVAWRVRLARGEKHADVEAAIQQASDNLTKALALALFDDPDRGGDVLPKLNRAYGQRSADAYRACRRGVHGAHLADLPLLVADIRQLIARLG